MSTIFTRIIDGELPGHFIWKDDLCVAFMTIAPIRRGHVLVVPRRETDHWIDAEPSLLEHAVGVAQIVGSAIQDEYRPGRVGMMIAGFEVPHMHIHVMPIDTMADMDFGNADSEIPSTDLADDAIRLRRALERAGHTPAA